MAKSSASLVYKPQIINLIQRLWQRRHLGGGWGPSPPPPSKEEEKKKKKKKRKRERKEKKREKRKKGTMNSVKLLHIKCCFFQFFKGPVALNKKNFGPPRKS